MESGDGATKQPAQNHDHGDSLSSEQIDQYWKANVRLMLVLLLVWFTVSFGFGILLAESLNKIEFFGFKLGFWWAQQGSIYVFVLLIVIYIVLMKRLDKRFGVDDD